MNMPLGIGFSSLDNKKYQFILPAALVAAFDAVAVEQHRTRSDALRESMRLYVERNHERKKMLLEDAEDDDDDYEDEDEDEEEDDDDYE